MNRYHSASILLFFLGFIFISISVIQGEGRVALLLFIPIFYGSGIYSFFGIVCIIVAIFLAFFGYALRFKWDLVEEEPIEKISSKEGVKKRFGGVVLIGPIPIIIGSDTKLVIIALLLAVVLVIAAFFLFY
jgi:uncharacterized protein (TIGR00304 family)